jgi:phosphoserine phosphatase RsbU/P
MLAKLVSLSGATMGREYPLREICILGRSPNAQIRVPDLSISRQHAKITRSISGYVIEDLDSGLGTLVNRSAITASHLRHGDEITIGSFSFRFVDAPLERKATADFSLVFDERDAQVASVDASEFARLQPVAANVNAETMAKLTRRLNAMLAVSRAVSSSLEPTAVLNEVLRHCLEVLPAAGRALVAVPNRETQSLEVRVMVMREGQTPGGFGLSRTITSEVLYKGRSVVSNTADIAGSTGKASLMVAPLICRGQMLGLLYVDRCAAGAPFTQADLEVLTGMATQTALALHNAHMHERLMQQSRREQELAAAHEVQKRFMPRGVPKMLGFSFVAHYDPSRDVGGDLYDFIPLDANHLGVVVGDVAGKGFAAALVMAWVASQLRVAAHQEKRPSDVLARINESLLESRQDDLFVTLFYGVLDRLTMSIRFCSAGHLPPLVRRRRGGVEVVEEGTGMPVGMVADAKFDEGRILLERGDTVLLVSDGVTEAMDPQRHMFGLEGLRTAVARSGPAPTDCVAAVLSALRAFVREQVQYDDITIVGVGAGGTSEDVRATMPPGTVIDTDL